MSDEDSTPLACQSGDVMPVLPLRNMVLYPQVVMPVSVGRKKSLKLIREVYNNSGELFVTTQRDARVEEPTLTDLYPIGTIARIIRILEMPDGSTTVILQGKQRAKILQVNALDPYMMASVDLLTESFPKDDDRVFIALLEAIKELAVKIIKNSGSMPEEASFAIRNIEQPSSLINFICANFGLKLTEKERLLELDDMKERGYQLLDVLTKESQLLEIKASIQSKARLDMDQQQREYYLQQQMKTIQEELGGGGAEQEISSFREKAKTKKWDVKTAEIFQKELAKLERTHPHAPDYSVQLNYVETLVNLPWNDYTNDNFDLKKAQKVLDRDHFGLDKVKERIIEHLAVLKLKGDLKAPIICLYGPPGVGKTSLGKSIAETLGRKYIRMSLGGLHDESEIRGHRRTYIGAMPGRIIQNLNKAGSSNPVFVLDEIDKVSSDFKGDPASALLEVLDPEQNNAFHDNFLDVDYDLSKVLFIATANTLSSVSQPLLDRMELIEVTGYIAEEKVEIAMRHLIPKQLAAHGIDKSRIKFSKSVVRHLVDNYTRESGVRELDRVIAKLMRKVARKIASDEVFEPALTIEDLKVYLGAPRYMHDFYQGNDYYGVVTGLAWTSVGGEILYIESSLSKGKGGKLTLTGNLGEVMKESAMLALEYLKAHADLFGIDEVMFEDYNVHIHVPEGAIPKDGPSAGITMLTALASAFTKRKVRKNLAMTGEITLRGKLLPVGGIKEKILAAKRAGITDIILCEDNRKDIEEISDIYLKGLHFHFVKDVREALKEALL
ncbi:MAG: endopeptidase La [Paludibacteraceae bacterium]|nr:endopeptidase La [Paludibacteraceae bacterium]